MDHLLSREKDNTKQQKFIDFIKFEFDKFYLVLRDLISQSNTAWMTVIILLLKKVFEK